MTKKKKIRSFLSTLAVLIIFTIVGIFETADISNMDLRQILFTGLGVFAGVCFRHFLKPVLHNYLENASISKDDSKK